MLNRLAVLVVLWLALSAISASAQNTIIDSNGTVVGNVVGVSRSDISGDTLKAVVATQDANGLWVAMELIADGFVPSPTAAQCITPTQPAQRHHISSCQEGRRCFVDCGDFRATNLTPVGTIPATLLSR